mmetsp:Transcript_50685/g.122022  ORF Transcript_50685/g.122022 Transcript_50685/m.122022 type:complete len:189 (-) Transcript_50685:60-626(-)
MNPEDHEIQVPSLMGGDLKDKTAYVIELPKLDEYGCPCGCCCCIQGCFSDYPDCCGVQFKGNVLCCSKAMAVKCFQFGQDSACSLCDCDCDTGLCDGKDRNLEGEDGGWKIMNWNCDCVSLFCCECHYATTFDCSDITCYRVEFQQFCITGRAAIPCSEKVPNVCAVCGIFCCGEEEWEALKASEEAK